MTSLVTLERVKQALNIDHDDQDAWLGLLIEGASASVVNYLGAQAEGAIGDSGVPPAIQTATLMLVGHIYKEPDGDADKAFSPGYLPAPVTALLYPLRDPALR